MNLNSEEFVNSLGTQSVSPQFMIGKEDFLGFFLPRPVSAHFLIGHPQEEEMFSL